MSINTSAKRSIKAMSFKSLQQWQKRKANILKALFIIILEKYIQLLDVNFIKTLKSSPKIIRKEDSTKKIIVILGRQTKLLQIVLAFSQMINGLKRLFVYLRENLDNLIWILTLSLKFSNFDHVIMIMNFKLPKIKNNHYFETKYLSMKIPWMWSKEFIEKHHIHFKN
ncbi:hypothetical protein BpHYR1_033288 [Brachionus plicatilis]|uniref:Uncharacterized protein n=1 Tax=Brachionus plicatilis TaxID=10195 RepID=A0A3M7R893_BRAPC|nr:hypothetical protein BpHYR1_033288 [Brachionus plicatilis]